MPSILEENKAIFRVDSGSATFFDGGREQTVQLATTLHGTPCVKFEDGTTVYWEWQELLQQAFELKNARLQTDA